MDTKFEPRTRYEIKEVRWFQVDELPVHRKDDRIKQKLGFSANSFFMVTPFIKALKQWISLKTQSNMISNKSNKNQQRPQSTTNFRSVNNKSQHHSKVHQHHHHHHNNSLQQSTTFNDEYSNEYFSQLSNNKSKLHSRSNENLTSPNRNSKQNQKFPNSFSFSNSKKKVNNNNRERAPNSDQQDQIKNKYSVKQQSQYYLKLQKQEFSELLNIRDANSNKNNNVSSLTSSNVKLNTNKTSKFRPFQTNENIKEINTLKNHYSGPDCWTNFKFDFESLMQTLPISPSSMNHCSNLTN
jgi:hypothetical protein